MPSKHRVTSATPIFQDLLENATQTAYGLHWLGHDLMSGEQYAPMIEKFAGTLSPGNIFEAATIIVSYSGSAACEWLRDIQNGDRSDENRSVVLSWNHRFGNSHSVTLVFYMRASVDAHVRASKKVRDMAGYLQESYAGFRDNRRYLSRLSLQFPTPLIPRPGLQDHPADRFFRQVEPNIDNNGFTSLGIVCITTMVHTFRLNMGDTVSLLVALAVSNPNSMEPLAKITLHKLWAGLPNTNVFHKFKLGLELHQAMFKFQDRRMKRFRSRFATYHLCKLTKDDVFYRLCEQLFWFFMHLWVKHPRTQGSASRVKAYWH